MPLKEGTTVEDVLRVIVETTRTMADGYRQSEDDCSDVAETAVGNAGYFMLRGLGFNHDEAHTMFNSATLSQEQKP